MAQFILLDQHMNLLIETNQNGLIRNHGQEQFGLNLLDHGSSFI